MLSSQFNSIFLNQISNQNATKVIIRLRNLRQNYRNLRSYLGSHTAICGVVKANAYGHGLIRVSQVLTEEGVDTLGVYSVEDACILRDAGIRIPILLMGLCMPDEIPVAVASYVIPFISSVDQVYQWQRQARYQGVCLQVHIAVDTGMGSIGCLIDDVLEISKALETSDCLRLSGAMTHLACADETDMTFTQTQLTKFENALDIMQDKRRNLILHVANSAGIFQSQSTHYDMVRIGISLYGHIPTTFIKLHNLPRVFPVMELVSHVIFLKKIPAGTSISYGNHYTAPCETYVAIVPLGYSSGYNRCLSGFSEVLISGKKYPVVGVICMDQLVVDIGNPTLVRLYDSVSFFGDLDGYLCIEPLAQKSQTVAHEILATICPTIARIYEDETIF